MAKNKQYRKSNNQQGATVNEDTQDQNMEQDPITTEDIPEPIEQNIVEEVVEPVQEVQASMAPGVVDQGVQVKESAPEPVQVKEEVMPVVQQKQEVTSTEFDTLIDNLRQNGTAAQKALIASLDGYLIKMAPGVPIGEEKGAAQQYMLWKTIQSVCENSSQEEFKKLWNILLAYFDKNKDGAFHERYVFRFSEYWHYAEADLNALQRVLNLIKLTANQNDRVTGLKQVDLIRTLAEGFNDEARQRIVQFYNK